MTVTSVSTLIYSVQRARASEMRNAPLKELTKHLHLNECAPTPSVLQRGSWAAAEGFGPGAGSTGLRAWLCHSEAAGLGPTRLG